MPPVFPHRRPAVILLRYCGNCTDHQICHCEEAQPTWQSRRTRPNREKAIGENATASPRLHPKGTSSRFALRAPRQGSASCISALSYNILSKKSKIAINPDFSGPISPFRLLSQKKSVMMEGRICNCIFHGRFCRCPAFFRCITQPRPVKTNEKQGTRAFARQTVKKTAKPKASEGRKV